MIILITGTSRGIGKAIAEKFLKEGHVVVGIDRLPSFINHKAYKHYIADISNRENISALKELLKNVSFDIVINNAGVQNENDIDVNLKGTITITETFGIQNNVKAILMIGSASAHTGAEFPEYCASKGGLLAYTKNVAQRVAKYGATCNSIDAGGVITELNEPVLKDEKLWSQIMELTPLKRWANPQEIAEWAYFLTVTQSFMTGQNLLIDGGEAGSTRFIWPEI